MAYINGKNILAIKSDIGYADGYTDGEKSEYDRFWDNYQNNGERTDYSSAFRMGWNDITFKPKYDLVLSNASSMFAYAEITDLSHILKSQNILFDTSNVKNMTSMFQLSSVTKVPKLDLSSATAQTNQIFNSCSGLVEVEEMVFHSGVSTTASMFGYCTNLKHIKISGEIAVEINFQWSPLSVESIKSIISALKNYAGTASDGVNKIVFSSSCWDALEADSTAPDGGTWKNYVNFTLGWAT